MNGADRGQDAPSWRLYRVPEAMRLLSMSRSVIYEQLRSGRLESAVQGRTRLIPAWALEKYVARLVEESSGTWPRSSRAQASGSARMWRVRR